MKNTNKCPKCSGEKIIKIPGRNRNSYFNLINAKMFSAIYVTRYLCNKCGYSEEWIDGKEDINKLVERYGK
ncbi:MAG: hypothetical protein WCT36_01185 [Candidatus Gracilibacteria bacterium]|jgi:predicted nucleic-acid-binding Zn-ribbon protein